MVVLTSEEGRAGTDAATPTLEEAGMPGAASPPSVEVLESGPTSLGGGLHEEGDPKTDEMWRAATSADVPASATMTAGGRYKQCGGNSACGSGSILD
jgi:hypothetical protein